jgi:replicative DNA helicase
VTWLDGASFALDAPTHVDAVWGDGSRVLWAKGEPVMLAGPDGVGKTTIVQQMALRLAGIGAPELLSYTIELSDGKVLYLALDRPRQAARSMKRMVGEPDREALAHGLAVWAGQLPFDVVREPERLAVFAQEREAGTVVIDSLKDVADKLSDEAVGSAINRAMQICVAAGVEVLALHHQRKAQSDNKTPNKLSDVYGSRWLTAGCGSVLMLWGEAGDPIVEFTHLKQPADEVGPLTLLHDSHAGTTSLVHEGGDVVTLLRGCTEPLTAKQIAERLYGASERKDTAKAKRKLDAAVRDGHAERLPTGDGEAALWTAAGGVHTRGAHGVHGGVHGQGARPASLKRGAMHPPHNEGARYAHADGNGDPPDGWTDELPDGWTLEELEASRATSEAWLAGEVG